MDLSIIIVNFNTRKLLGDCLASIIKNSEGIKYEVIVVDNGSSDRSPALVKGLVKKHKHLKLIQNHDNFGFAKANNQGIGVARGRHILLLNSDTLVHDQTLKKMVNFMDEKKGAGVVGPKLVYANGRPQLSTAPFLKLPIVFLWLLTGDRFLYRSPPAAQEVDWVMGSALLVRRKVVEKLGMLDEKFFMYVEEQEWCYRIKKAGWQVWFYPDAVITHLVRGSSPEGKGRAIAWIYRSLIYFYAKHFAPWKLYVLKFLLILKAIALFWLGSVTGKKTLKKTYADAFHQIKKSRSLVE